MHRLSFILMEEMHHTLRQNTEKKFWLLSLDSGEGLTDCPETWGRIKLHQGKIFSSAKYEDVLRNVYPISDWSMECIPIF